MKADNYTPIGHMRVGDAKAADVGHVTLDGQRIRRVVECDDVEGWLLRYSNIVDANPASGSSARTDPPGSPLKTERLTGVVRVDRKAAA